jgi:uncharacterized protein (UPF0276 family)
VKPLGVGVLYNRALTELLLSGALPVNYVEIIPDRSWTDRGRAATPRYEEHPRDVALVEALAQRYPLVGHGVGLSIASAGAFDLDHVTQLARWRRRFGLHWVSEHLAAVRVSEEGVIDHHAGIALPLAWDEELLRLVAVRVRQAADVLGCPLLLENGVVFTPVPEPDMSEAEFLNRLVGESPCRILLDLHNLYANATNLGIDAARFLGDLDLTAVVEIHIAGGNEFGGFYLDSHAGACPQQVWEMLEVVAAEAPNLRAITFEFHESYFAQLTVAGLEHELARASEIWRATQRERDVAAGVSTGNG